MASHGVGFGKVPLYFEENEGQIDTSARFLTRMGGHLGLIVEDGLALWFGDQAITMHIVDADPKAPLTAEGVVEGVSNYYLSKRTFTGVKHFSSVRARNIRPNIDILYHGSDQNLEYDLVIRPGANPKALRLRFEGGSARLADNGDVVLETKSGELRQHVPRVWQQRGSQHREIACKYVLSGPDEVQLQLASYDQSRELVVDPILSYSTYLGGVSTDEPSGIAVDSTGFAYIAGYTYSSTFPVTSGAFHGYPDAFVSKLNASGTGLIYSTFIGGSSQNLANAIAINAGNAYVTGSTNSFDFPFTSGHEDANGYTDGFVLELNSSGNLVYAIDLGGTDSDSGNAIAVDTTGAAYVAGNTDSPDFPVTAGALKTASGTNGNAFVAKISPSGQIVFATYLGGTAFDTASAIAVDSLGDTYIGGTTTSSNFPVTKSAFSQTLNGGQDAFVAKLNPAGSELLYATFLGGSSSETAGGLAIDGAGDCYVTGTTSSFDFPTTTGAFITAVPEYRMSWYVTKLNATGTKLVYSTYLLGSPLGSSSIAVNSTESAFVSGTSTGSFPTTPGALRTLSSNFYETDAFLVRLSEAGTELTYSTLLGTTSATTQSSALALDGKGGVYVTGVTNSTTFPATSDAFQAANPKSSGQSGFVAKIDMNSLSLCEPSVSPASQNFAGRGGELAFELTLAPGCPWEAIPSSGITLNAPTHGVVASSPIHVTGAVQQNSNTYSGQTLSVVVGPATFTVNQDAGSCQDPVFTPTAVSYDSSGGLRNINLVLPGGCSWTAASSEPWLSITSTASGNGPASIAIFAGQNSFSARSATLTIDGKSIAVAQNGGKCTATVSETPLTFSGSGGTGSASITTSSNSCDWSAYSTAPWIQLVPEFSNGQGSGVTPFVVAANPGSVSRTGSILIANQTLTITQLAGPGGSVSNYTVSVFAGGGSNTVANLGDGGPATSAYLSPAGLAFDPATRKLYIVDAASSRIRVVTPDGNINTFAGGGTFTEEGVSVLSAQLVTPQRVAVDPSSSVYVSDSANRVRKISNGVINTFAGSVAPGFGGDFGAATAAFMNGVRGIASDSLGNIYIVDQYNNRIRKVTGGIITTFAGGGSGNLGDGGPAASATLDFPAGVAVGGNQTVYIADTDNSRVRSVASGTINTLAQAPYASDVAVDSLGNVFAASTNSFEMISPSGTVSNLNSYVEMNGLAADLSGDVFISDSYYGLVHELTPIPSFCSYSVAAPSAHVGPVGQTIHITVTAAVGCNWTAISDSPWATISSGSSGDGNGKVSIIFAANTADSQRTATLAIGGQVVSLIQNRAN